MSRRILLADDSVTIQKVIELTFMDEDFAVTPVGNGDEALAKLPEVQPDLVIADVHMPGANGYEVCRRAKAARPSIPVLLLVGTFEPFDEVQARAAGADAHLKKPFDSQELLTLVQQLLERAPAGAAPTIAAAPVAAAPEHLASAPASPAAPPAPLAAAMAAWENFELEPEAAPAPAAEPLAPNPPSPPSHPSAQGVDETPASAGRSAGFDWADTARFGRVDEQTFELEDTGEALGLDDSLLEDEPYAPADHADHADHAEHADHREDTHPSAAPAAPRQPEDLGMPFPLPLEEHAGVPAGSAPLTSGLAEIEEHVHHAEERREQPVVTAPPAPPAAEGIAPSVPAAPEPPAPIAPAVAAEPPAAMPGRLTDDDVERIARRVVELVGDKAVRDVAWEVIPDMAEVVIKDRLRELESQVE
jgi:CheY-like chemotaxis protein